MLEEKPSIEGPHLIMTQERDTLISEEVKVNLKEIRTGPDLP
jgi:hypothetical protein